MDFVVGALEGSCVKGLRVIEIGSMNVNGSVRQIIERLGPLEYTGVDMTAGPGVDIVCPVENLLERFSPGTFGLVVCTEMLEHVRDWRRAVGNMKALLAEGGVLLITTRSQGFAYHPFPADFWRYEGLDMREIFSDLAILSLESDSTSPGIFLKAVKKEPYVEKDLANYKLYSMIKGRRVVDVTDRDCRIFNVSRFIRSLPREAVSFLLPGPVKRFIKATLRFF